LSRFTYDPSLYLRRIWKNYPRSHKADYTRADGIVGYAWIAGYTLEFRDGYDLMQENHLPEAMDVLKLDGYDSLGEAYMKGEKQLAIDSYKKSLELNPANDNAKEKLKMLETATAAK
jgi:hypothetical protein